MISGGFTMPLRDHFRPPLADKRSWDELHGGWPMMLVAALSKKLPPFYVAGPRVHLATSFQIDVASYEEEEEATPLSSWGGAEEGGVATEVWAPPQPTMVVTTDLPDQDEYEVRVYDTRHGRRLVAAVEIVSPSNKDRPESRRLFVAKCAALLREACCRHHRRRGHNVRVQLVCRAAGVDRSGRPLPGSQATSRVCRGLPVEARGRLLAPVAWAHALVVGAPFPTLPL
jgi:hypothetical protein